MSCVAYFIGKNIPKYSDYDFILKYAQANQVQILGFYVCPIDLQHYGRVDTLITAGAAYDFIKYVEKQDMTTAQEVFKPLIDFLEPHSISVSIQVIYGDKGVKECLTKLKENYAKLLVLPSNLK
ncbi:hypothetical protein [Desulfovibrio litoralis]|uniref:Uncharacterized protein n=1 Tax=Desulfovibrio litoralis DSM 11393 TaxID=1121455 RepID=A0A1M7RWM0_9BACT|nr:hypothetical protein [Desulfovibrio litoralis]SHN50561.1 hypothetical protein SAMN02745728_00261 [Desulfovibrio litoralis DSM 11393]